MPSSKPTTTPRPRKRPRGTCPVCGYTARLVADGTLGIHWLYVGREGRICVGWGERPDV